jgi:hypothetical protein
VAAAAEQVRIAATIDAKAQAFLGAGPNDVEILAEVYDYNTCPESFAHLIRRRLRFA